MMLVPGWWYVITAESFLDRMTEMPDVLELASTIKCPTLFIRGDQEDPDIPRKPSERVPAGLAMSKSCGTATTSMLAARLRSVTSFPAGSRER
jgi:hypothetical protein